MVRRVRDSYTEHSEDTLFAAKAAEIPLKFLMPDYSEDFDPYEHWDEEIGVDLRLYNQDRNSWNIGTPLRRWSDNALHRTEGSKFITALAIGHGKAAKIIFAAVWDDKKWKEFTESPRPNQSKRALRGAMIYADFARWLDPYRDDEDVPELKF